MTQYSSAVNYDVEPGMCIGETKCRNNGPRCYAGFCHECCLKHKPEHQQANPHEPPPKRGEFRPLAPKFLVNTSLKLLRGEAA